MTLLTDEMQQIIGNYSAGAVASVNDDGSPAVSPKATFVVVDNSRIAFGNIRSPATRANLLKRPAVEVSFTDLLARVAVRVSGKAEAVDKESELGQVLTPHFEKLWSAYLPIMKDFICINIDNAELIRSPAYDVGFERDELVKTNFEKLRKLTQ